MNTLRNSILAATTGLALAAPAAFADTGFQLSDKLSVTGFLDMSMVTVDPDNGDSTQSTGVDQFEIDFLFNTGEGLSAQVDLEYQDNGSGEEVDIEQAFIAYQATDEFSVKAGRFLSYSGWETEEPTGLYQYSGAGYAAYFYGGYQQGVSGLYATSSFDLGLSLVSDLGDLEGEARDTEELAVEAMVAIHPIDAWTLKAFYMVDELSGTSEDTELVNIWTSYAIGSLTLAAEYNTSENAPAAVSFAGLNAEADGYLLMANYGWDKYGVTLRYHDWEVEDSAGVTMEEINGATFALSYAVNDNLLMVTEFRSDEDDLTGADWNTYAVEALFTF